MSRSGLVTADWGDGTHEFRLPYKQLELLQESLDSGPQEVFRRFHLGSWRVADVSETLRLALIGGGMPADKALNLVRDYIDQWPWTKSIELALSVLEATLIGPADEKLGKGQSPATVTEKGKLNSPPSTVQAPSSASRRSKPAK